MSVERTLIGIGVGTMYWAGGAMMLSFATRKVRGWDRIFLIAAVGWAVLICGLEVLSVFGALRLAPFGLLATGVFLAGGFLFFCRVPHDKRDSFSGQTEKDRSVFKPRWPSSALIAVVLVAGCYQMIRGVWLPVETISDAPIYHLHFALRWWQEGIIEPVATPFGELAATYFPSNGALWFSWLILLCDSVSVAKIGQAPFWLLGALGIYAISRLLGTGHLSAMIPSALWATCASVLFQGVGIANVDLIFTAWYFLSVYFLIRYLSVVWNKDREEIPDSVRLWLLAGCAVSVGCALGTHPIGLLYIPFVVLPLVIAFIWHRASWTSWTVLCLGGVIPCGFWYIRNFYWTGNPFYPQHLEWWSTPVFQGWYDREVMIRSGYHLPVGQWGLFLERFAAVIDVRVLGGFHTTRAGEESSQFYAGLLDILALLHLSIWPVAMVTGIVMSMVPAGDPFLVARRRTVWLMVWMSTGLIVVYWFVLPYQSQQRFLFPAVGLSVVPLSLMLERVRYAKSIVILVIAGHVFLPISPQSNRPGMVLPPSLNEVSPGAFLPYWGFARQMVDGWGQVEKYSEGRSVRIAYAGTNLPYYLYGNSQKNHVCYVNVNEFSESLPHDYHFRRLASKQTELSETPWPQWHRRNASYQQWLDNLRRQDIELVFVSVENRHAQAGIQTESEFPLEWEWAKQHPEAFNVLFRDRFVWLFQLKPDR